MARITINGVSLDPASSVPLVAALATADASHSDYVLVQSNAPLTEQQKGQLDGAGFKIGEYVSENTYLGSYKPADLSPVRALPFVSWAGVYHHGFKIPPSLRPPVATSQTASIGGPDLGPLTSRTPHYVDVVLHQDVDPNDPATKAKIAAAAPILRLVKALSTAPRMALWCQALSRNPSYSGGGLAGGEARTPKYNSDKNRACCRTMVRITMLKNYKTTTTFRSIMREPPREHSPNSQGHCAEGSNAKSLVAWSDRAA